MEALNISTIRRISTAFQGATSLGEIVKIAREAVAATTRYRATWITALQEESDGWWCRILAIEGEMADIVWEKTPRFPVGNDPFLLACFEAVEPVIIDDMRTDPRTDKGIVSQTDHRTSITIPMSNAGPKKFFLCIGTFGAEGVLSPTQTEIDHLIVLACLVDAALNKVQILTERNRMEEQSRQTAEKKKALEETVRHLERLETAGQLASGIAHDFNNLLMAIAGHAELSLDKVPSGPVADSLKVILESIKKGAHLTHNLLSFTRHRLMTRSYVDLNQIVLKAQQLLLPSIPTGLDFHVFPAKEAITVHVDEVDLEHALINLVSNARDAISGPGEISLKVQSFPVDDAFIDKYEGRLTGTCACISVHDNGSGIPPELQERIFDPFFTTKSLGRGTGLGLAMVRSLVEQHGGVISVDSELGRGSDFSIYLPLASQTATATPKTNQTGMAGRGETVLIAEDDDVVRALLVRVLRGQGYQVLEAGDGQSAIDLFRAESDRIRLVLTDLMMPRKSGGDVVQAVLAYHQRTAIIVMSGFNADPQSVGHFAELGVSILNKPVTPTKILLKVRQALEKLG